jgi:hypothetical protein
MDSQTQIMYVAGAFFLAASLLIMLPLGSPAAPAAPVSDYAGYTANFGANTTGQFCFLASCVDYDSIPIIGTVAGFLDSTGDFLGSIAGLLSPSTYFTAWGLPPLLTNLLVGVCALIIGFGAIYLWKGTL